MMLYLTAVLYFCLAPAQAYKFAVFTSATLGNFRDLSGLINGLLNFRHDVHLLVPDDNRTQPDLAGFNRIQRLEYRSSGQNPHDSQRRYELIYQQKLSELNQLDLDTVNYECSEVLDQKTELLEKMGRRGVDIIILDADFSCYYQIAQDSGLPFISLASKSTPHLMKTHALTTQTCYLEENNSILTRITAFWNYLRQETSPASDSSLWLWNTNGIVDCLGPTGPNVLQVGGLSHREEQPLPEELDKLCTNAKYGVIVFSMPGVHYSDQFVDKFLDAFEQLDQTVLWRTSGNVDRRLPPNVLTTSLLSENDLLAHVNVKLMLTDGDNARQLDSLFHGVPVISIALTQSQRYLADRLRIKGHGTGLNLDFTSDELVTVINDLLYDVTVTEKARKASALLKGSPDYRYIAVYWLDLIARHGADHLKSLQLNTLQFYMVDVIAIMLTGSLLIAYLLTTLIRFVVGLILNRKPSKMVVIKEGVQAKTKPKLDSTDFKPKESKPEKKSESEGETSPEKTNIPVLQHQGSKKHKKKKNK